MEKQKTPKPMKADPKKAPTHKRMHDEAVIPPSEPQEDADVRPMIQPEEDRESFRLT
jgi:hypothetical protein